MFAASGAALGGSLFDEYARNCWPSDEIRADAKVPGRATAAKPAANAGPVRLSFTFAANDVGLDACSGCYEPDLQQDGSFSIVELTGNGRKCGFSGLMNK